MLARLRQMTDAVSDTHLTDPEMYAALTSAVAETWDLILSSGVGDEYVKKVSFNTQANVVEYPTATIFSAGDFYKISAIYVDEGQGQLRPLNRISPYEEQAYRAPASIIPIIAYYIPCAPTWSTGAESFDGINGWEEHTLNTAAIFVKAKKEDDATTFRQRKRELEGRISTMANRSRGEPPRVVRKRRAQAMDNYAAWQNNVSCWDLRGVNLELYYRFGYNR